MKCSSCGSKAYRIIVSEGQEICENCGGFSVAAGTKLDNSLIRKRVRQDSVMHEGDILPPYSYDKTTKKPVPNPEFIKKYPSEAHTYFTRDEMQRYGLTKLVKHTEKIKAKRQKLESWKDKVYYGQGNTKNKMKEIVKR